MASSWEHCSGEARARTSEATWTHDICFTEFAAFDPVVTKNMAEQSGLVEDSFADVRELCWSFDTDLLGQCP